MVGQTLSHYRVLEKIGEGGMGVVYRAHDERLDRNTALKVLPAGTLSDQAARWRFRKEALALAKLNHPHIGAIYDFDSQAGVDFLVMEYVSGCTLAERLGAGSLHQKEVLSLGAQIAAALEEAHEHGVIHCDLKPGNIILTPKAQVKLLDFGLAKLFRPVSETTTLTTETATGAGAGTLPYMAPEQLRGEGVDARTDIYALGVVLYEMATGQRPFREALAPRLTDDILHQAPVPPRLLKPRVSPELEGIILKCLEKDPENRYQSAKEVGVDLRRLGNILSGPASRSAAPATAQWRRAWLPAVGAIAVLVAVLALVNVGGWRQRLRHGGAGAQQIRSLAVLPLENLSGHPEEDYFADGMTEALITEMSKVSALRVISRTSVMAYKGARKPMPQIARELNVDAVLAGSILRAGDRVRITTQLIDAPRDRNLWGEVYERDMRDILNLQREVARALAEKTQVTLTPRERLVLAAARQVNPQAYQAYLKGRFYLNTRKRENLGKGLEYFRQAIALDPRYAEAYTGQADSYVLLVSYGVLPASEGTPRAEASARKALELDDTLAEAHTSLAQIRRMFDWDWAGAEKSFRRAIELNPGNAAAHHWYALELAGLGRAQEALAEIQQAQNLDPLSPIINANMAWCHYLAGQYDPAIERARKTLELFPDFAVAHEYLGQAYAEKSMLAEAIAELRKAVDLSGGHVADHPALGYVYGLASKRSEALQTLSELRKQSKQNYNFPYSMAVVYAGLGDKGQVLQWLQKSYDERDDHLANLKVHPVFARFRSDPRFQELLQHMNLLQ